MILKREDKRMKIEIPMALASCTVSLKTGECSDFKILNESRLVDVTDFVKPLLNKLFMPSNFEPSTID